MRQPIFVVILLSFLLLLTTGCDTVEEPTAEEAQKIITSLIPKKADWLDIPRPKKSKFMLKDLDGDGISEAVAFYKQAKDDRIHILIAKKVESDQWTHHTFSQRGQTLEFADLQDFSGNGKPDLVLGLKEKKEKRKTVNILTLTEEQKNHSIFKTSYDHMTTGDLDQDRKPELALLTNEKDDYQMNLRLFTAGEKKPELVATKKLGVQVLPDDEGTLTQVLIGNVDRKRRAIIVDAMNGGRVASTLLYHLEDGQLKPLVPPENFLDREAAAVSMDIDGDGVIEFPNMLRPPSLSYDDYVDHFIWIREWHHVTSNNRLEPFQQTIDSYGRGFRFLYRRSGKGSIRCEITGGILEIT